MAKNENTGLTINGVQYLKQEFLRRKNILENKEALII